MLRASEQQHEHEHEEKEIEQFATTNFSPFFLPEIGLKP